jgi:hypothetical protein
MGSNLRSVVSVWSVIFVSIMCCRSIQFCLRKHRKKSNEEIERERSERSQALKQRISHIMTESDEHLLCKCSLVIQVNFLSIPIVVSGKHGLEHVMCPT